MDHLRETLATPLLETAGAQITIGSTILGVAIFLGALLVARLASRGVERMVARRGQSEGTQYAFSRITRYAIIALGVGIALSAVGFNLTALLAASTVVLVGIGLGLQNIAQNFISGIIVLVEQPVRKGDFIRIGDSVGTVSDIGLRATTVITRDEVTIIVPNSELVGGQVVNHSKPTHNLRVQIPIGVHYRSDPAEVKQVLSTAMATSPRVLQEPPPEVRFEGFGESSLDFSVLVWIADPREDLRISSELRFAIHAALKAAAIEIPYPQRDLHLRSGLEVLREARATNRP